MQDIYSGETRNGFMHLTTDRDCLPADIIRFRETVVINDRDLMRMAHALEQRGFHVIVNTATIQYATGVADSPCPVCCPRSN